MHDRYNYYRNMYMAGNWNGSDGQNWENTRGQSWYAETLAEPKRNEDYWRNGWTEEADGRKYPPQRQPLRSETTGLQENYYMPWHMVTLRHSYAGSGASSSLVGKNYEIITKPFFCPIFCVVEIGGGAYTAGPFLESAVHLCNHGIGDSVACTVIAHKSVNMRPTPTVTSPLERAVEELAFGCIGVNTWARHCAMMPDATWGAHPGEDFRIPRSGRGHSTNGKFVDDPVKSVVWSPLVHKHHLWPDECTSVSSAESLVHYIVEPGVLSTVATLPGGCAMSSRGKLNTGKGSNQNCTIS